MKTCIGFIFLLVMIITINPAKAQEETALYWGGMGYASVGYAPTSFSNLESSLRASSLISEGISQNGITFGGGGFGLIGKRIVIGGKGFGVLYPSQSNATAEVKYNLSGGGVNVGYAFFNQNDMLIFPGIGFGGIGGNLEVQNKQTAAISFGDYDIESNTTQEFQMGTAYLDFNLNVQKLFNLSDSEDPAGLSAGLSVGYQLGLIDDRWEVADGELTIDGIPSESVNIFYVKLLIGGGGFGRID